MIRLRKIIHAEVQCFATIDALIYDSIGTLYFKDVVMPLNEIDYGNFVQILCKYGIGFVPRSYVQYKL